MSGGSQPSNTTTVQRSEPPAYLLPVLRGAAANLGEQFGGGAYPEYYPYSQVTPLAGQTREAVTRSQGTANQQATVGQGTVKAVEDIYGSMDVGNDPYLAHAAEAAVAPIYKNLSESILPQIGDRGIVSGTFGGDRQAVYENQAIDQTNKQALDATSLLYANALQNAYSNSAKVALGLPAVTSGLQAPTETLFRSGGVLENYNQALLNDQIARFAYEQNIPFDMAQRYWGLLNGINPGQTQTTTPPGGTAISPATGALGGAAAGYAAYPAGGWYSAGAGALLGLLASN